LKLVIAFAEPDCASCATACPNAEACTPTFWAVSLNLARKLIANLARAVVERERVKERERRCWAMTRGREGHPLPHPVRLGG
jgi:hypothetical protein